MSLSPQWLDELRSRITLSSLIGRTVRVQRAGREFKACCPFHNEKTPSFTINDEKGFYHCFGCSAHGDAIRWMTDQRGLSFMDAVKELAAEAGMQVPAPDPRAAKQAEKRASLHDVMAAAQGWFEQQLASPAGAAAREYLQRRGVSEGARRAFGFGFAPDDRKAIRSALGQFPVEMLVEAGLLIQVDGKDPYARFRGRLMLPIRDPRGRVIAFGGRILGDGEPKYLNSPDTPLFDKGRTLYNIDKASPASRKTNRVLVAEGYMDVVALTKAGFEDAVAPMGTALTEPQIERLWKLSETPILCFDGDNAGQKAALRAATRALPLLRPGHSLSIALMPPGQDPDDLVKAGGAKAINRVLDEAVPLFDFLWSRELSALTVATPEARAGFKQRIDDHIGSIGHSDIQRLYREEAKQRFDALFFRPRPTFQYGKKARGKGQFQRHQQLPPSAEAKAIGQDASDDPLFLAVLKGLLVFPPVIVRQLETLAQYVPQNGKFSTLFDMLLELGSEMEPQVERAQLFTILTERGLGEQVEAVRQAKALRFTFCNFREDLDARQAERDLEEAIALLVQRPSLDRALAEATRRFEESLEDRFFKEQLSLKERKLAFDRRVMQLADKP